MKGVTLKTEKPNVAVTKAAAPLFRKAPAWQRKEAVAGYLFAMPWFLGFIGFTAYPMVMSILYSFTDYNILETPIFIGLNNYKKLFRDPLFYTSLYNTFYYTIIGVPLNMAVGLAIAMLLNKEIKGMSVFRTLYYVPSIVPLVASTILWAWMFSPSCGLLTNAVETIGLSAPGWLSDPGVSKNSLILMSLWGAGSGMIIYLAGLKNIPRVYYEAAEIDGANALRKFTKITLPFLSPTLFYQLIMGLIGGFQVFTQAFIMTDGGPNDSTLFYVLYLFNNAFKFWKMGYSSALAWILFIIILIFTLLNFLFSKYWVNYDQS